jgi:hypothetical protein
MAQIEVVRQYMFPVRRFDFPVESEKRQEGRRPNFKVPRLLDEAITDGRIGRGDRDRWVRTFEETPHLARRMLSEKAPEPLRASRNFFDDPVNERAYRDYFVAAHGEEPI